MPGTSQRHQVHLLHAPVCGRFTDTHDDILERSSEPTSTQQRLGAFPAIALLPTEVSMDPVLLRTMPDEAPRGQVSTSTTRHTIRTAAQQLIRADRGGLLELTLRPQDLEVAPAIPIQFRVRPHALQEDTLIRMSVSWQTAHSGTGHELRSLVFDFGPSGTQFGIDAELMLPFSLLRTSDMDTFAIDYLHDEDEAGFQCSMEPTTEGVVAHIPHFSRYHFVRR